MCTLDCSEHFGINFLKINLTFEDTNLYNTKRYLTLY